MCVYVHVCGKSVKHIVDHVGDQVDHLTDLRLTLLHLHCQQHRPISLTMPSQLIP